MADVFQLAERTALPDQPAPDTASESTIAPPPPQPATGGARVFDIAENAPQNYVKDYLKESVGKGRQWGDVENRLKELGFDPSKIKDGYQVESAKLKTLRPQEKGLVEKAADFVGSPFGYETTAGPETTLQKFKRSYMPYGDAVGANGNTAYSAAQLNVKNGKGTQDDYDKIARYETVQKLDETMLKTPEGKLADSVGQISKIVAEMGLGGAVLGKAGALTGIGQADKLTALGRFGGFAGKQALTLPLAPSMYIPMAQQNNIAQGRAANDWRGYPTALGYGYANLLVLGSLQGNMTGSVVSQALKKGALGTAELTGVDVAAGLADEALPKSFQVGTKYGTLGQLARGAGFDVGGKANPDDLRQGLEHVAIQILTFSALSAMHGRSPNLITDPAARQINALRDAGLSEKAAGEVEQKRTIDPIQSVLRDPTITREKAIEQLGDAYHNNPVVKAFVDGLPPTQEPPNPPTYTPPDQSTAAAMDQAKSRSAGGETFQSPEPVPSKSETSQPRSTVEVLGEDAIRKFAKLRGYSSVGKIENVIERLRRSPTDANGLDQLVNKRLAESEKPTVPEIASDASKTVEKAPPVESPVKPPETGFTPQTPTETAPRGERVHIANYKDPSRSVDKAVEMMEKRGSASLPVETWQDAENAKGQQAAGTAAFVFNTTNFSGEIHGRKGIDNLRNSKFPLPYDPALTKVRFKGDAAGPEYEKLRDAVYAMNRRRADAPLMKSVGNDGKLPPVRIEVSGQGPVPGNKLIQFDRRSGVSEGNERRREADKVEQPVETFQPEPALQPSRLEQMRAKQQGRATPAPEKATTVLERHDWVQTATEAMSDAGITRKEAQVFWDELQRRELKDGWPAARDWFEKRVGSKIRDMAANDVADERAFEATPYSSITKTRRAKLDPLIERISHETGRSREVLEQSVRAAQASGGPEAVDILIGTWTERVHGYDPTPQQHLKDVVEGETLRRDLDSDYPSGPDERSILGDADRLAAAHLGRVEAARAIQQSDAVTAGEPENSPRPRKSRKARVQLPAPGPAEEPGPEAPAGQAGSSVEPKPIDAAGLESNPNADKELLGRLKDSAPASARDYLESAAWNTPSEKTNLSPADRRHATVERIATEWGNATMAGGTEAVNYLRSLMLRFGGTVYGAKAGSPVSFDPARYGGPKGEPLNRSVGAKVRVVREPVVSTSFDGREGLALKGIVEPIDRFAGAKQKAIVEGPKERAQRANETKWVADENALREQGVVTLAEEVRTQYGGIDPDDFRKNHGEGEYQKAQESSGNSMFSGKDGGKGTGKIEDIMAQMKENGQLGNRDLSPEQFLELAGKHVPIEDASGKGYETAQQRDAHRQASQDIRDRFLAENPDATPAEVEKAVKEGLTKQVNKPWQPGAADIPMHTPKDETFQPSNGVEPSSKPVKAPTPYELAATIDSVLGVTNYTESQTPYGNPVAVAVLKAGEAQPQAVVTQKMYAGEPTVRLEEAGHVLAARYKLELSPAALPPDVAQGFLEFWGKRGETQSRLSTLEGFSQWLIQRTGGKLDPSTQTPAQKAAAAYAEAFVKKNGLEKPLSQIEPLYRAWDSLPPIEKAAKLLSGTGAQANPQLSPQQKVKAATDSIQERFQDDIDTNLGPLYRVEKWLEGKLGRKLGFAEKASTVFSQLMGQEKSLAGSYLRDGVKTLVDGKWVTVGQSEAKILEGAKPEWLTPLFDGGPSKFDLWVTSRHIEGEAGRREAEQVRAKLDPKVKVRAEVVPESMRADYKVAADELAQDAEFKAWAEPAAERLTRAFKDTLHALEGNGIHALPVGTADLLHAKRPDYVPTERVLSDKSWNAVTGSRGERGRAVIKERSGSGEQIVSPLVSYRKRLLLIASVQARQLKFNAMSKIAQQPGMGDYLLAGEAKLSQAGEVAFNRINDKLAELGIEGADVTQMMKDVGISNGEAMFLNEPWSQDATKNTYWGIGEDGRPTNFRVADRALYELVTDQQVESHQLAKIVNGIANFSVGGVRPVKAMSDVVKLGATSANLAFHLRNIPRDAYTFWTNTIDRATIGQLPEALRRAFAFEFGVLKANLKGETFQSADKLFQLFHDARGDQLRELAFDRNAPQGASGVGGPKTQVGKAYYSVAGFIKDALNTLGAGELGPRFLEFKTRLKQLTGLDEAGLVKELDRAEKEAAAGREYVQPFDYAKILDSMDAAAEVTTPFNRQGVLTRELNKIQPYFGPAIAGASKAVRNIRDNPKGAAMGMAAIASLRVIHWLANKDEQWYEELSANDRYRNFVVQTPWGLRRIPAPRGLEVPVGGFLLPMLDKAAGKKPDVKGLVSATWEDLAPPKPLTPLGTVGSEIAMNQNWRGTPIVPGRDEHLSQIDKITQYQGPYAVEQLTGGRGQLSLRGAGLVPFTEVQNARRSVDEFYQTYQELETARRSAQNRGERFTEEQRYLQFERAKKQIEDLSRQIRGDRLVGGKVTKGEPPAEERIKDLRDRQLQVARNLVSPSR